MPHVILRDEAIKALKQANRHHLQIADYLADEINVGYDLSNPADCKETTEHLTGLALAVDDLHHAGLLNDVELNMLIGRIDSNLARLDGAAQPEDSGAALQRELQQIKDAGTYGDRSGQGLKLLVPVVGNETAILIWDDLEGYRKEFTVTGPDVGALMDLDGYHAVDPVSEFKQNHPATWAYLLEHFHRLRVVYG